MVTMSSQSVCVLESFNPCPGLLLAIRNPNASHLVHFWDVSADFKALAQSVHWRLDFYQGLMFFAGALSKGSVFVWDGGRVTRWWWGVVAIFTFVRQIIRSHRGCLWERLR